MVSVHAELMHQFVAYIFTNNNNKDMIMKEREVVKSEQHQILNVKMPLYINLTDDSICGSNIQEHDFFFDLKHFFM